MKPMQVCPKISELMLTPYARRFASTSHRSTRDISASHSASNNTIPAFLLPSFSQKSIHWPIQDGRSSSLPFASQRRAFSHSPAHRAVVVAANPRKDADGNDMIVDITPRAAQRLREIQQQDNNPFLALRVTVQAGGCHGFQYLMSLTDTKHSNHDAPSNPSEASPPPPSKEKQEEAQDTIFEESSTHTDGSIKARVIMDEPSLELLKGSAVDYTMELIGSQFKIVGNPAATSSCGCGTSFDIKA